MNRVRAWGLSAALAAGGGGGAAAAEPPPAPPEPTTLYAKFLAPAKPKPGPVAARPPAVAPLPPEVVATALRAEQEAWDRRMAVCIRLREAALAANDEVLMRRVDDLERQAAALYAARAAALGVPKAKAPAPDAAAALDRQLGTGVAVTPLSAPAAPVPAGPADAAGRTASLRTGGRP